ncbi:MAG TPA: tetratricopeptide repeat protein [Acidobacteriota bacterium]|nr:tetratricopeptide repeat protein [Acidobacteriota bacterium]
MSRCIDKQYGDMLYAYELGMLSEEESRAFEQHLIECEFCCLRAEKNLDVAELVRHDPEIHDYAISLAEKEAAGAAPLRKRIWSRWKYSMPVAAAILLLLLLVDWQVDIRTDNEAVASDNRLAVLQFTNVAEPQDQDHLSDIATNLLIADLGESKYLRVISSAYMLDLASARGIDRSEIQRPEAAIELAREARANWILTGELLRVDSGIVITSRLAEVTTGNVLSTQRVTGGPDEDIFSVIDRLSAQIRLDLPLPILAREATDLPISDITTHSADAFRHYLSGVEFVTRFYTAEGIAEFERALEYDSTFAMAYYYLSQSRNRDLIEQARKYSEHASQKEKHYIESRYHLIRGDTALAISLLQDLIEEYPDEAYAFWQLGFIQRMTGKVREAIPYFEAALRVNPFYRSAYNSLAYAYDNTGDWERAILSVNRYIEIAPDEPNPYDTRGDLFLHHGDVDAALKSYLQALRIKPDHFTTLQTCGHLYLLKQDYERADSCYRVCALRGEDGLRARAREFLAYVPLAQGQFTSTLAVLDSMAAVDMTDRQFEAAVRKRLMKARILAELGDFRQAIATIEACEQIGEPISAGARLLCRTDRVQTLTDAGQLAQAESALEVIRSEHMSDSSLPWNYWYLRGYIDFSQGRIASAISAFTEIHSGSLHFPVRYWLARAYLADGHLSQASDAFEAIWDDYSAERYYYGIWFVKARYFLGQTYEESNWPDKAIEQYEAFLSRWDNADATPPEITDARDRLSRLRAGS